MHICIQYKHMHACSVNIWKQLPLETIKFVCQICSDAGVPGVVWTTLLLVCCYFPPVWYEPTCVDKAVKPIEVDCLSKITYSSPHTSHIQYMKYNIHLRCPHEEVALTGLKVELVDEVADLSRESARCRWTGSWRKVRKYRTRGIRNCTCVGDCYRYVLVIEMMCSEWN